jgi:hypothetical protein
MTIDEAKIRNTFIALGLYGDDERGLISRFGILLNTSPVNFLVGREIDLINTLGLQARPLAEKVMIDAAQWSAYATFEGILKSQEWADLIEPEVHNMQDRFDGMVVLTNCLGWGRIIEHKLDETRQELEFTVDQSYYIDYWLSKYGKPDYPICHMWTGTAAGYMDLLFGQKVHDFVGEEVSCAARDGGELCTFKARRVKKKFGLS